MTQLIIFPFFVSLVVILIYAAAIYGYQIYAAFKNYYMDVLLNQTTILTGLFVLLSFLFSMGVIVRALILIFGW